MYQGLYDTRRGLTDADSSEIGIMTARLLLPWNRWVHRRVERLEFCDEDAVRRNVSIDFTLPYWFHEIRATPLREPKRHLVPLLFLRKGALLNFGLWTENGTSLPLLNSAQNAQVAEATLVALAGTVLNAPVPPEIRCDIRSLVRQPKTEALATYNNLFNSSDPAASARAALGKHPVFPVTAEAFVENYLALTVLDIRRHERRIVHLSYEDTLVEILSKRRRSRLEQLRSIAFGRSRIMAFAVPTVGDADSYHFEVESPDDLQVNTREHYHRVQPGVTPQPTVKSGSYKRVHIHFPQAEPGTLASVAVRLLPRSSTIVRSAVFASLLALIAILVVTLRIDEIKQGATGGETAATLLLATIGIAGLFIVRQSESLMSTGLLLPVRVLAILPVVMGFMAAVVIAGDLSLNLTRVLLSVACGLTLLGTLELIRTWRRVASAARK
jgi:hypothetical protein